MIFFLAVAAVLFVIAKSRGEAGSFLVALGVVLFIVLLVIPSLKGR